MSSLPVTEQGLILSHHGVSPEVKDALYIAPNATLVGDVVAGVDTSFWFNCVVRGDVGIIRIGEASNVQDFSMLHVSYKKADLHVGREVTIGHHCVLHGCRVGDRVLVGMGSVLMDHVEVGDEVLVGAGSLLTEGMRVPAGSLVLGRPARVVRELNSAERAFLKRSAFHYTQVARSYRGGPWPYDGALHDPGE